MMDSNGQTQPVLHVVDEPEQHPHTAALERYLIERGYARNTVRSYLGYASHFLRWVQRARHELTAVDEAIVTQFLNQHLPHCDCGWPTRSDHREAHAALHHLIIVLRTLGLIAARSVSTTPIDEELRRF